MPSASRSCAAISTWGKGVDSDCNGWRRSRPFRRPGRAFAIKCAGWFCWIGGRLQERSKPLAPSLSGSISWAPTSILVALGCGFRPCTAAAGRVVRIDPCACGLSEHSNFQLEPLSAIERRAQPMTMPDRPKTRADHQTPTFDFATQFSDPSRSGEARGEGSRFGRDLETSVFRTAQSEAQSPGLTDGVKKSDFRAGRSISCDIRRLSKIHAAGRSREGDPQTQHDRFSRPGAQQSPLSVLGDSPAGRAFDRNRDASGKAGRSPGFIRSLTRNATRFVLVVSREPQGGRIPSRPLAGPGRTAIGRSARSAPGR